MNVAKKTKTLERKLERACQAIMFLKKRCDKFEKMFERVRADASHQERNIQHIGYRADAITHHFDRTPLKFNDLHERIENLEVQLDKRKKRTGPCIFDKYE